MNSCSRIQIIDPGYLAPKATYLASLPETPSAAWSSSSRGIRACMNVLNWHVSR